MKWNNKILKWISIAILAVWLSAEVAVRILGMTDFPVYVADAKIGYYLKPSQHGRFNNQNEWKVNANGFLADDFKPDERKNILLIGDSIVMGGNPMDHSHRLGTLLDGEVGKIWKVWPAGAASWSVMNEVAFLQAHEKDLAKMHVLVWVINSGDFVGPSVWLSSRTHPRRHPIFATWYLFDKYVWARYVEPKWQEYRAVPPNSSVVSQPTDFAFEAFDEYIQFAKSRFPRIKNAIVWYPDAQEEQESLPFWEDLTSRLRAYCEKENILLIEVRESDKWNKSYYRDQIHPTEEGNAILAKIIAEKFLPNPEGKK